MQTRITTNIQKKLSPITACRSCDSRDLPKILSLGKQGLSDFIEKSSKVKIAKYPLELVLCRNCNLLQMRHTTPPDQLYTERYGYRSGINQTIRNDLLSIAEQAEKIKNLRPDDIVVDIGCNDGTLLSSYQTKGLVLAGFDPVTSFTKYSRGKLESKGVREYKIFNTYFTSEPFSKYFGKKKAKVVTAISMFYDLDNPNSFLTDVKKNITSKWIINNSTKLFSWDVNTVRIR